MVIGLDPGVRGGIAALRTTGELYALDVMPTDEEGEVDARALALLLWALDASTSVVAVERVHSMPKQGVASTFTFGRRYGVVLGVLGGLGVRPVMVEPRVWKRAHLGKATPDEDKKAATVAWARSRWPGVQLVPPRCRVAHDGLADALGIAEWCRLRKA